MAIWEFKNSALARNRLHNGLSLHRASSHSNLQEVGWAPKSIKAQLYEALKRQG
jgi:hypothetical protein